MLEKRKQLYAVAEDIEGQYAGSFGGTSAFGLRLVNDLKFEPSFTEHPRNFVAESLSMEGSDIGRQTAKVSFSVDVNGSGTIATEPLFSYFLKACGMRPIRLKSFVPAGAITGTLQHGETIQTSATAPAQGKVIGTYTGTPDKIIYMPLLDCDVPIGASDALTGATSGATVSVSGAAPLDQGWAYLPSTSIVFKTTRSATWKLLIGGADNQPLYGATIYGNTSENWAQLLRPLGDNTEAAQDVYLEPTVGLLQDGEVISFASDPFNYTTMDSDLLPNGNYALSFGFIWDGVLITMRGCRGNWKLEMKAGEPVRMQFEFEGLIHAIADLPSHTFNAPTITSALRFGSADFKLDSIAQKISQLNLDFGASLAVRDDPSFPFGAMSYRITARDPGGSMDPEMNTLAIWPWYTKLTQGHLPAQQSDIRVRMGTTEAGIGDDSLHSEAATVWIDVPKAQLVPVNFGNREGILTADATFKARRQAWYGDDEIALYVL